MQKFVLNQWKQINLSAGASSFRVFYFVSILISFSLVCRSLVTWQSPVITLTANEPDLTLTATPMVTPESTIFRDDFNGRLNPEWVWQNEDASHYKVNEDGWLEITGGDEGISAGGQQTNLVWVPLPEGGFEIYREKLQSKE